MRKKTLTPDRLLSTWELKEYVNKYSPDHLKHHFDLNLKNFINESIIYSRF